MVDIVITMTLFVMVFIITVIVRQAGTWDPLLQGLHLDKRLLKQQNTKKL